jgi:hypothetical protein
MKCLLKKQEFMTLKCNARSPALRLFQRGRFLLRRKRENPNSHGPLRPNHGILMRHVAQIMLR